MTRLLFNPLFWAIALVVVWIVAVTVMIASNPEAAHVTQSQAPVIQHR